MPIYAIRNCKSTGNWASHRGPILPIVQLHSPQVHCCWCKGGDSECKERSLTEFFVPVFTWMSSNGFMNSGSCAFIDLRQGRQAAPPTMWSTSDELLCQSSEQTFQNETHVDLCGPSESPLSLESDLWLLKSILGYWNFIASQYVPFDVPAQKPLKNDKRSCLHGYHMLISMNSFHGWHTVQRNSDPDAGGQLSSVSGLHHHNAPCNCQLWGIQICENITVPGLEQVCHVLLMFLK